MRRTEMIPGTVTYAVQYQRIPRPAVLLSTAPHELTHEFDRGGTGYPWTLRTDSGQYRGYGDLDAGTWTRSRTSRGLPAVVAYQTGVDLVTLSNLGQQLITNGFLRKYQRLQLADGVALAVVRPQDVTMTWAEHQAVVEEAGRKQRERIDRRDRLTREANDAKARVHALLTRLGVTVDPPLRDNPRTEIPCFGGCTWDSLEKLLEHVARAAADEAEQFARDTR